MTRKYPHYQKSHGCVVFYAQKYFKFKSSMVNALLNTVRSSIIIWLYIFFPHKLGTGEKIYYIFNYKYKMPFLHFKYFFIIYNIIAFNFEPQLLQIVLQSRRAIFSLCALIFSLRKELQVLSTLNFSRTAYCVPPMTKNRNVQNVNTYFIITIFKNNNLSTFNSIFSTYWLFVQNIK